MFNLHNWTWAEDVTIATYVINRKTDKKSVYKLCGILGLKEGKVSYRMSNFEQLYKGEYKGRHYSRQEREVLEWLTSRNGLNIKPL